MLRCNYCLGITLRPICLVLILAGNCSGQELPTFSESVVAYRHNMSSALPISVEWLVTDREFSAAIELDIANITQGRLMLEAATDQATKEQLKYNISENEGIVTKESQQVRLQSKVRRHFVWTDGKRFHYRTSNNPKVDLGIDIGSSLVDGFANRNVYSYSPDRVPKLKVWQGYATDGKTLTGYIATKETGGLFDRAFLPPLGFVKEEWKRSQRFSALDRWTDLPMGHQSSLAGDIVGGDETILIRNATKNNGPGIGRTTAWCAYQKGFIPKRLEFGHSGGQLTAMPTDEFPVHVRETVVVNDIQVVSGIFYPKSITTTRFGFDAKWYLANPGIPDERTNVPHVPLSERVEEILTIKVNHQVPQRWLDLPFPKGTRFMDLDTKEMYLEGTPKDEYDRQLVAELTKGTGVDIHRVGLERKSNTSRTIVWANIAAFVVLGVVYVYTRRGARGIK